MRLRNASMLMLMVVSPALHAASGSWNGVAFSAWNGLAQTAWNGSAISCASSATNLTAGLIAWYKFDDGSGTTATDSSGSGFSGTLSGAVLPAWVAGQIGTGALSFNGTNAYVDLGTQVRAALAYTNTGGFTVTLWIKPTMTRASGVNQHPFASATIGASADRMSIQVSPGVSAIYYGMYNGASVGKSASGFTHTNTWVFCSMAWSNATTLFGYTNATVVTGTTSGNVESTAATRIGTSSTVATYPFKGEIDDVRIYNRPLLSDEISYLYQWRP